MSARRGGRSLPGTRIRRKTSGSKDRPGRRRRIVTAAGFLARSDAPRTGPTQSAGTAVTSIGLALAALIAAAAAIRFSTLDVQSYWDDEAATVSLVRLDFWKMLQTIPKTESTPPLYYILAWVWARLFGTGEFALRSLSRCSASQPSVVTRPRTSSRVAPPSLRPSCRLQSIPRLVLTGGSLLRALYIPQRPRVSLLCPLSERRAARRALVLGHRLCPGAL